MAGMLLKNPKAKPKIWTEKEMKLPEKLVRRRARTAQITTDLGRLHSLSERMARETVWF
jgi:hypothetical protein